MSDPVADPAAALAAAQAAALRAFNIELWTLYAAGVLITIFRTYARVKAVGFDDLRADDLLIWLAILFYTAQSTLAYFAVNHGHGLANNSMTDLQRAALSPSSEEYHLRVFGSKIQVAGWTTYVCLIFILKMCMLVFYVRLTDGLSRRFRMGVWIGWGIVISTFVASFLTVYTACRPLSKYWQINPDPGNSCQSAVASPIVWVTFISSVITDLYLLTIPMPMLWSANLKLAQKLGSSLVLGAGVFVLVCALLKTVFVLVDPVNGAKAAGEWGTREAFISVVVTNMPMLLSLIRSWLKSVFGTAFSSAPKVYSHPTGFRTISGGDGTDSHNISRRRVPTTSRNNPSANLTITESEERIINEVKMQNLKVYARPPASASDLPTNGIVVSNEFQVTEDRSSQASDQKVQRVHESW